MKQVNDFERMLVEDGIYLIKLYFSITKEEQEKRFLKIKTDPLKKWKMSPVDDRAQELWTEYSKYKNKMFDHTHTEHAPWKIFRANKKNDARILAMKHVLSVLPYNQ